MDGMRRHISRPGALIAVRPADASDAAAIGAVFDAAVRVGWTYLGGLVQRPMFASTCVTRR
jgi:hypothetical protein